MGTLRLCAGVLIYNGVCWKGYLSPMPQNHAFVERLRTFDMVENFLLSPVRREAGYLFTPENFTPLENLVSNYVPLLKNVLSVHLPLGDHLKKELCSEHFS